MSLTGRWDGTVDWFGNCRSRVRRPYLVIPVQEVLSMIEREGKGATFSTRHSLCFLCVPEESLTDSPGA